MNGLSEGSLKTSFCWRATLLKSNKYENMIYEGVFVWFAHHVLGIITLSSTIK